MKISYITSVAVLVASTNIFASTPNIECEYRIGFSRSDHGSEEFHFVKVKGGFDDTFAIKGCSAEYGAGKMCASKYGVSKGARHIVNQDDVVVAEANCCNSVQNYITSVEKVCRTDIAYPSIVEKQ